MRSTQKRRAGERTSPCLRHTGQTQLAAQDSEEQALAVIEAATSTSLRLGGVPTATASTHGTRRADRAPRRAQRRNNQIDDARDRKWPARRHRPKERPDRRCPRPKMACEAATKGTNSDNLQHNQKRRQRDQRSGSPTSDGTARPQAGASEGRTTAPRNEGRRQRLSGVRSGTGNRWGRGDVCRMRPGTSGQLEGPAAGRNFRAPRHNEGDSDDADPFPQQYNEGNTTSDTALADKGPTSVRSDEERISRRGFPFFFNFC